MSNIKRTTTILRFVITVTAVLFFAVFLLSGCVDDATEPSPTPEVEEDTPFMWQVTAPSGQTMHIYGSIHAATADLYPLPDVVMNAFNSSDYLAVESWDPEGPSLKERYIYEDGRTITEYIPEELYQRAIAFLKEHGNTYMRRIEQAGISLETLSNYKPLLLFTLITGVAIEKSSISSQYGLESHFLSQAFEKQMEILSIESPGETTEAMLGFSIPLQIELIEGALDIDKSIEGVERLYEAWKKGDEQATLDASISDLGMLSEDTLAEYLDVLLTQRNIRMADSAESFMNEGKQVFFLVGALHTLGEDSVIDILIERGYEVERAK